MKLAILLGFALVSGLQAQSVPIPRIETDLTLDGTLGAPVWRQAARLDGFKQYQPVDSRPVDSQLVDSRSAISASP